MKCRVCELIDKYLETRDETLLSNVKEFCEKCEEMWHALLMVRN